MQPFLLVHSVKKILAHLGLFSIFVFSQNINAQDVKHSENNITFSGQLRSRFEFRDGVFRPIAPGEKPAVLISQRIRLAIDYAYKDILTIKLVPQSVGIWGQANMVQTLEGNGNQFALFEAWAALKLTDYWKLKIGRQVISLDDERIFGELDWAQGGRVHDALSFQFNKNQFDLKAFFACNQNYKNLYDNNINNPAGSLFNSKGSASYKWMQTVWTGFQVSKTSKVTLLVSNVGFQNAESPNYDSRVFYSQTAGANFFHQGAKLTGNFSAYYQGGKNTTGIKTRAFLIAGYADYTLNPSWSLGAGSDFLSGNDVGKPLNHNKAFNPFFNTGHKFYGAMDYYYAGNPHKNAGLSDNYFRINYKTNKSWVFQMSMHQFITPNTISGTVKDYDKNLGQEFDLSFIRKINKFTGFSGGYSCYLTTPTVHYLKNTVGAGKAQQWVWLSLNITPTFLEAKF